MKPIQRECERERTIIARINMCIEKQLLMSMPVEISLEHLINSSITEDQIKYIYYFRTLKSVEDAALYTILTFNTLGSDNDLVFNGFLKRHNRFIYINSVIICNFPVILLYPITLKYRLLSFFFPYNLFFPFRSFQSVCIYGSSHITEHY